MISSMTSCALTEEGKKQFPGSLFVSNINNSPDILATAFLTIQVDCLLPVLFWERQPDIEEFLSWRRNPNNLFLGGFVRPDLDSPDKITLAGIGFVMDVMGPEYSRRGDVGFAFFKKFWGGSAPLELARMMVDHVFKNTNTSCLYGFTPTPNQMAVSFSKKVGFHQVVVPSYGSWRGKPSDCVMSVMTREMWG